MARRGLRLPTAPRPARLAITAEDRYLLYVNAVAGAGPALAGAMLSYARGTGSYDGDAGAGTVESTLTGVFPFAGVDLSDRPVTASMVIMTLGLRLPRRYD